MVEKFGQFKDRDAYESLCEEATVLHQRITNLKRLLAEAERENQKLRSQLEAKDAVSGEVAAETDSPPESQQQEGDRTDIEVVETEDSESSVSGETEPVSTDIESFDREESESSVTAPDIQDRQSNKTDIERIDTDASDGSQTRDNSGAIGGGKNDALDFISNGSARVEGIEKNGTVPVSKGGATATAIAPPKPETSESEEDDLDEIPDEVEMSLFDHLEELRQRIFYSLIAVTGGIVLCFIAVKPIVKLLQIPAQGVKMLQLAPGEYFFVSLKVAGYSGLILASPFIIYQIVQFVLPGLTRRERRILGPIFLGSTFLFLIGLIFAYVAIVPAALKFFIGYGAEVVEQLWSIAEYFEFVLKLLFVTAIAFQVPIILILLGILGIVSSKQMFSGWRYVVLAAAVLGAILTPSTDPLTQSLLGGAVVFLYFAGVGVVRLMGK